MAKSRVRLTKNFSLRRTGQDLTGMKIPRVARQSIADLIVAKIVSGSSPVKGKGQFKDYRNESYKGRTAPVDMVQSGDMLNSLQVQRTKTGLKIFFKSFLADIHNKGNRGKNLPKRRLLPSGSESFTKKIADAIFKTVEDAVKKVVKKANK